MESAVRYDFSFPPKSSALNGNNNSSHMQPPSAISNNHINGSSQNYHHNQYHYNNNNYHNHHTIYGQPHYYQQRRHNDQHHQYNNSHSVVGYVQNTYSVNSQQQQIQQQNCSLAKSASTSLLSCVSNTIPNNNYKLHHQTNTCTNVHCNGCPPKETHHFVHSVSNCNGQYTKNNNVSSYSSKSKNSNSSYVNNQPQTVASSLQSPPTQQLGKNGSSGHHQVGAPSTPKDTNCSFTFDDLKNTLAFMDDSPLINSNNASRQTSVSNNHNANPPPSSSSVTTVLTVMPSIQTSSGDCSTSISSLSSSSSSSSGLSSSASCNSCCLPPITTSTVTSIGNGHHSNYPTLPKSNSNPMLLSAGSTSSSSALSTSPSSVSTKSSSGSSGGNNNSSQPSAAAAGHHKHRASGSVVDFLMLRKSPSSNELDTHNHHQNHNGHHHQHHHHHRHNHQLPQHQRYSQQSSTNTLVSSASSSSLIAPVNLFGPPKPPSLSSSTVATAMNGINNAMPGINVAVETAAKKYRCAAQNSEATCCWKGKLPPKQYKTPIVYSTKVFVGGLPWDITEDDLVKEFGVFGPCRVEWTNKERYNIMQQQYQQQPPCDEQPLQQHNRRSVGGNMANNKQQNNNSNNNNSESSKQRMSPGFAYVIYESEYSVRGLVSNCIEDYQNGRDRVEYYFKISTRRVRNKEVQIIPWILADNNFALCTPKELDPKKTVFVGNLHGTMAARDLAHIMNELFGCVVYAGIDIDKLKYPIGSGRVTFSHQQNFMRAVRAAFVDIQASKFSKRIQIDPYLEDVQCCMCFGDKGIYFCRDFQCFNYYCGGCWEKQHSYSTMGNHKPLMRKREDNRPIGQ